MITNLTIPFVKGLYPKKKRYVAWDDTTKGFGVVVQPSGKKSYIVQALDDRSGKILRKKIATVEGTPLKEARSLAEMALMDMRKESGLLERIVENNRRKDSDAVQITVAELIEKFMNEYAYVHCKPRSAKEYKISLETHFLPSFGDKKINKVQRSDLRKLHSSLSKTPYAGNRMLAAVSKMYNQEINWELWDGLENPCRGIQKHPEKQRERYLRPEELNCLHLSLVDEEPVAPMAVAAFRLLLRSGARVGEIQTLKWSYIDGNQINLPDSKTGRKAIPLSLKAIKILEDIPRVDGNEYVFAGKNPGTYLVNFKDPWKRVRDRASVYFLRNYSSEQLAKLVKDMELSLGKLPSFVDCQAAALERGLKIPEGLSTLRMHDLRHNFASQLVMSGEGIAMAKEILGHKRIETTARYAHLDTTAVQEATERFSGAFDADDDVNRDQPVQKIGLL